jgi:hypothetical protein
MNNRFFRALAAVVAAWLVAACTSHVIIRDEIAQSSPALCDYAAPDPSGAGWAYHRCEKFAVEVHPLQGAPGGAFKLAFVEFDDQGWFYRYQQNDDGRQPIAVASQMKLLEDLLREEGQSRDLIIVAYVHGWKHDASVCDEDVCCFRAVLRAVQETEVRQYGPAARRVVGIYVGWRGREMVGSSDAQERRHARRARLGARAVRHARQVPPGPKRRRARTRAGRRGTRPGRAH